MASEEEIMTFYGRCRCCLEYGYMKSMWKEHMWEDEREIYGEMLMDTFNLSWGSDSCDEHICETCVTRLRDAYHFKKEILSAENMLQEDFQEDDYEIETLKEELFTDEEYDLNTSMKTEQVEDKDNDFKSADDKAEYCEIEFLEEDAEIVEQSVNTLEKETDTENKPKRKWPRKKKKHERSSYRNYTENDMKQCIAAIQTRGLSQSEAARMFNIPPKTVNGRMQSLQKQHNVKSDSQEVQKHEVQKHRENIRTVLTYTNATVIRGHRGVGYQCYFCPKQYRDPADLKTHSITHKNLANNLRITILSNYTIKIDTTRLVCKICHSDLDNLKIEEVLQHLKRHGKTIHLDLKNHIMPFKFNSKHLECVICDERFSYFKILAAHMSQHYPNYRCKECGKGFINKHARRTHASRHITGEFSCGICNKIFATRIRKREHERVVHVLRNKTHKCNYCSEKFVDAVQKKNHEVSQHGIEAPQFCCQYCDKIFESQRSLTCHVKRCHLQLKPHECPYCQKRFFKKSAMQRHIVSHTGEKNYKCLICEKYYGSRSALRTHLKTHSEAKGTREGRDEKNDYFCIDCGFEFEQAAFQTHDCNGTLELYEGGELI